MKNPSALSRRDFLRQSTAAAAAGMAAPLVLPSGVLALDGKPGANERITIGAIGVGRQGGGLLGILAGLKNARVAAVADVNLPRARQVAGKLKAEACQDYRRILERKDIDAIVTATPDHWRALVCIHACQAGKDVYAEKPLTLTIREGRLIAEAVHKYKRVLQTGSQQRSMAANRLGCELVRNGRIGKIKRVIAHNYPSPWECGLPGQPVPEGIDWDMWCGPVQVLPYHADLYAPRTKPGWISFRLFSGGEMTGWGSHGLDQIQWALGMDHTGPIEVWTEGEKLRPPRCTEPESKSRGDKICSQPQVFIRYPGDIVVELGNGPAGGAVFIGEKGKITIDRAKVASDPPEIVKEPIKDGDLRLYKSDHHMQNWLDCIKTRQQPVADVEAGHRTATVCHLGNIARLLGRRLRWDPVKETFLDDSEANSHLDRPRRKPYQLPEKI